MFDHGHSFTLVVFYRSQLRTFTEEADAPADATKNFVARIRKASSRNDNSQGLADLAGPYYDGTLRLIVMNNDAEVLGCFSGKKFLSEFPSEQRRLFEGILFRMHFNPYLIFMGVLLVRVFAKSAEKAIDTLDRYLAAVKAGGDPESSMVQTRQASNGSLVGLARSSNLDCVVFAESGNEPFERGLVVAGRVSSEFISVPTEALIARFAANIAPNSLPPQFQAPDTDENIEL